MKWVANNDPVRGFCYPALTALQVAALGAVANGAVHARIKAYGYRQITSYYAYGREITSQINTLHNRRLIGYTRTVPGELGVTGAGMAELARLFGEPKW